MTVSIVHLSDIHLTSLTDPFWDKLPKLVACVVIHASSERSQVAIVLSGDLTQSGSVAEFDLAERLIVALREGFSEATLKEPVILMIPGNHDCNFDGDQSAREILLQSVKEASRPRESIEAAILQPLGNYYSFAASQPEIDSINKDDTYVRVCTFSTEDGPISVRLLNTAWMSVRHEKPGEHVFPLELLSPNTPSDPPRYSIGVMHHPFNWFRQPQAMHQLHAFMETHCDLILTGHEHVGDAYAVLKDLGSTITCLVGGALQEDGKPDSSQFTITALDFGTEQRRTSTFTWDATGAYYRCDSQDNPLRRNKERSDLRHEIDADFAVYLEETDIPLGTLKNYTVHLSDFYTFPDLRHNDADNEKARWTLVKGEDVVAVLAKESHVLITGPEKSGKTSFGKRLFADFHRSGKLPIVVDGNKIRVKRTAALSVDRIVAKALEEQYRDLRFDEYLQSDRSKRIAIIDDLHAAPLTSEERAKFLAEIERHFDQVICFCEHEYALEELRKNDGPSDPLDGYSHFGICEFGYLRLEALAQRWLNCGRNQDELPPEAVRKVCSAVEQVLRLDAIPHHPWILIVLIDQVETHGNVAATNGSYGHLFHAVITVALSRSTMGKLDISGLYTYLAELAFYLYQQRASSIDTDQAISFHDSYCRKYDVTLDHEKLRDDLINCGILRLDGSSLAFRAKYTFCFFVAWQLDRNLAQRKSGSEEMVAEISRTLHHEESANIIVFLAHLSNNPIVINTILKTAAGLLANEQLATIDDDVRILNAMDVATALKLPASLPDDNRRERKETEDRHVALRDPARGDGRKFQYSFTPRLCELW